MFAMKTRVKAMKTKTIWTPQQKQAVFQSRSEYEALYGGAAGGGKSDALLTEALRQVHRTFADPESQMNGRLRYL